MGEVVEKTGELCLNVGGRLQAEAWQSHAGVSAAGNVVVALAEVILGDDLKTEEEMPSDIRLARIKALISAADTLSLGGALRIILDDPTLSEEGRNLLETTGDDFDDARQAAYTLSVISAIDSQTAVSSHNNLGLISYAGDPVMDVVDRAGYSIG